MDMFDTLKKLSIEERARLKSSNYLGCDEDMAYEKICDIIINFFMYYLCNSKTDKIIVELKSDNSMIVEGEGFCPYIMTVGEQQKPLWETLFCNLGDVKPYTKMLGRVRNPSEAQFFCEYMDVVAIYNGEKHTLHFENGKIKETFSLKEIENTKKSISITWKPDYKLFGDFSADPNVIRKLLERYTAAILNKYIIFKPDNKNTEIIYYHKLSDRFKKALRDHYGTDCKSYTCKETFCEKFPEEEFSGDIELHMAWGEKDEVTELYYRNQYTPCFWAKLGLIEATREVLTDFFSNIYVAEEKLDQCVRSIFKHVNHISRMQLFKVETFYLDKNKLFFVEHVFRYIHYNKSINLIKKLLNYNYQEVIEILSNLLDVEIIEEVITTGQKF